jgi:hypothetical protein
MHPANSQRRRFLVRTLGTLVAATGAEALFSSCGSYSGTGGAYGNTSSPTTGGNCLSNGTSVAILVQHIPNHTLTIPTGDLSSTNSITYTLADNGAGHTHTVTLTAQDFANLRSNQGIAETSTLVDGHTHSVTVDCA